MKTCPVCRLHGLRGNVCSECGLVTKCLVCGRGVRIRDSVYEEHNVDALSKSATAGRCISSGARSEIR